jgi:hypothetical protein
MDSKKNQSLVKWDINFLEYPNWIVNSNKPIKSFTIEKKDSSGNIIGVYSVSTTEEVDRLPDRVDKSILYYLLLSRKQAVQTTRYKISQGVFNARSPHHYNRIMQALKRWFCISIEFKGLFYEEEGYSNRLFHILDLPLIQPRFHIVEDVTLKKDGSLFIRFNQTFYDQLEKTNFFKYVDFSEFKKLKKPISAMLYEHLIKQFKGRVFWKTKIKKLAEKLTIINPDEPDKYQYYPSEILRLLKTAVNEINKNTSLKFTMDYDEDKKICMFELLGKDSKLSPSAGDSEELTRLLALLPEALKGQRSVKAILEGYLKEKGYQFVQSNIIYALQNSKKNMKAFLKKALLNDYGEETRAMAVSEEEQRRKAKAIEETRAKKDADDMALLDRVKGWIEKHGGKEKALYQGYPVVACNADFMAVQISKNERKSFDLVDVKEKGFGKSSK